jgi:hypothetical protein
MRERLSAQTLMDHKVAPVRSSAPITNPVPSSNPLADIIFVCVDPNNLLHERLPSPNPASRLPRRETDDIQESAVVVCRARGAVGEYVGFLALFRCAAGWGYNDLLRSIVVSVSLLVFSTLVIFARSFGHSFHLDRRRHCSTFLDLWV